MANQRAKEDLNVFDEHLSPHVPVGFVMVLDRDVCRVYESRNGQRIGFTAAFFWLMLATLAELPLNSATQNMRLDQHV